MGVSKMRWLILLTFALMACSPPPKKSFPTVRVPPLPYNAPPIDVDALFPPKQKPVTCYTMPWGDGTSTTTCY